MRGLLLPVLLCLVVVVVVVVVVVLHVGVFEGGEVLWENEGGGLRQCCRGRG